VDHWTPLPEYVKHVRVWNRHPRRGWESDSPVRASMDVLREIRLYDDRIAAQAISRLIGAGMMFIPQGMRLPSPTGDMKDGSPQDFLRLLIQVASIAVKDRRSPAANIPILIEADRDDIAAMKDAHHTFSTPFDEKILEMRESAIRRWATGVDLPAESMLGISSATHWNAALISDDQIKSFVVPSLKRTTGNITIGALWPYLLSVGTPDMSLQLWPDTTNLRARVENTEESQWAHDRFLISDADALVASSLAHTHVPDDNQLKRQMLMHLARTQPQFIGMILRELGIANSIPDVEKITVSTKEAEGSGRMPGDGRQGPQEDQGQDRRPSNGSTPGRSATLETKGT
jgi:hypothetical protein